MALINMTVNKREKCVFLVSQNLQGSSQGLILSYMGSICMCICKGYGFENGLDFEHFGLHQHWEICSPSPFRNRSQMVRTEKWHTR